MLIFAKLCQFSYLQTIHLQTKPDECDKKSSVSPANPQNASELRSHNNSAVLSYNERKLDEKSSPNKVYNFDV